jgi:hypothetical protein
MLCTLEEQLLPKKKKKKSCDLTGVMELDTGNHSPDLTALFFIYHSATKGKTKKDFCLVVRG